MDDFKFPRGETAILDLADKDGKVIFIITENKIRGLYYLYSIDGKIIEKLGKAESPTELERKFKTKEKMGCKG